MRRSMALRPPCSPHRCSSVLLLLLLLLLIGVSAHSCKRQHARPCCWRSLRPFAVETTDSPICALRLRVQREREEEERLHLEALSLRPRRPPR